MDESLWWTDESSGVAALVKLCPRGVHARESRRLPQEGDGEGEHGDAGDDRESADVDAEGGGAGDGLGVVGAVVGVDDAAGEGEGGADGVHVDLLGVVCRGCDSGRRVQFRCRNSEKMISVTG